MAVPLFDAPEAPAEPDRSARPPAEVLARRPECEVILFRKPPRLLVRPQAGVRLAAAALSLPRVSGALEARHASAALEVALEGAGALSGQRARLRVELADGAALELDFLLP